MRNKTILGRLKDIRCRFDAIIEACNGSDTTEPNPLAVTFEYTGGLQSIVSLVSGVGYSLDGTLTVVGQLGTTIVYENTVINDETPSVSNITGLTQGSYTFIYEGIVTLPDNSTLNFYVESGENEVVLGGGATASIPVLDSDTDTPIE